MTSIDKQKLLLEYCISSGDLFTKVNSILDSAYFDPQIRTAATFIKGYFEKYKAPPTIEQVKAESKIALHQKGELTKQEIDYASNEIEIFCKNSAIEKAIYASPALLKEGNYGGIEKLIKDAITIGLNKNVGLDYFEDPEDRLRKSEVNNKPISTGWIDLDELLGGGLMRQEFTIFAAASGVGKSLTMSNLVRNLVKQRLNVIYITLELSEDVVAKRFDSMFSGIGQTEIFKNISDVATHVSNEGQKAGKLFIKRMPESITNANSIRSYLKEFQMIHSIEIDAVILDYMDIMTSNQMISAENISQKDKAIAEEIRSIGFDYNCLIISASQLNRESHHTHISDLGHAQIAGGMTKINTSDNAIYVIQDDKMRAMKQYMFKLAKTRSSGGVGSFITLDVDPISLIISSQKGSNGMILNKKNSGTGPKKPAKSLLDIIDV